MGAYLIFCYFCPETISNVLVGSLHEDLEEDPGSWSYGNFILTRKLVWPMLIVHPH